MNWAAAFTWRCTTWRSVARARCWAKTRAATCWRWAFSCTTKCWPKPSRRCGPARSPTTDINLHAPALLPEHYCGDVQLRLSFYKKLASAKTPEQIDGLLEELV